MNEQEFTARVLAAKPRLHRVATAILDASPDRDDAWQNALLRAWRKLPGPQDEDKFESWLTRILVNECRDALRRRKRAALPVRDVSDAHPRRPKTKRCARRCSPSTPSCT